MTDGAVAMEWRALEYSVAISGLELAVVKFPQETRNSHFNKAMAALYSCGCRRIRAAVPVRPANYATDAEKYIVRGFVLQDGDY